MLVNSIQYFKRQKRISLFSILIVSCALLLALVCSFELLSKEHSNIAGATTFAIIGYTFRPLVIYFFILMTLRGKTKKYYLLLAVPLFINLIVYLLALVPSIKEQIFYFSYKDDGSGIAFGGGPLRFTSHIISTLYLIFLVYISVSHLRAKHFAHSIAILVCAAFVVTSVVLETFFDVDGELQLLNTTIGVSAITYYLYSYIERTQFDALTGLFNRETYYHDLPRMGKSLSGVIQFDLNGLKYINDNFGHLEGDKALSSVAELILKNSTKNMYVYRLGGDEFILLALNCSEEVILETIKRFKDDLDKTNYHCSTGYSYRNNSVDALEMVKEAEKRMYEDKEEFYKTAEFDRRKR